MFNRTCLLRLLLGASIGCATLSIDAQTVSKTFTNQSLKTVLKEIETQTGMSVIYKTDEVNKSKKVTITLTNASVTDALSKVLDPNLTWEIRDKMIVISRKNQSSSAKKVTVKGKILDSQNMPVIGASVIEKGTSNGTITDFDGNFTFTASENSVLEVSYVGYKSQQLAVVGGKELSIVLKEDTEVLDEVVVVGYGVQKKKLLTGATVQVKGEDLQKLNTVSPMGALQSQTPGVNIVKTSGMPGEGYKVSVRGIGTIGNSSPLYVVDGVTVGNIDNLNPADIQSIDILKDAASAAIYGARAANGVVLVTTKQGAKGKATINYDGYIGIQRMVNTVRPLNAQEYVEIMNEATEGTLNFEDFVPNWDAIQDGTWKGTNWFEEATNNNAPVKNHSLGIQGGTEMSRYSIGLAYTSHEGVYGKPAVPKMERYNARINTEHVLIKNNSFDILKVGENLNFSYTERNTIAVGDKFGNDVRPMLSACPLFSVYDQDGNYTYEVPEVEFTNPIGLLDYTKSGNKNKNTRLNGNIFLTLQPIRNLIYRSSFGINYQSSSGRSYVPVYDLGETKFNPLDIVRQNMSSGYNWVFENTVSYKFDIKDKHNFDVLLGMSAEKSGIGEKLNVSNKNSIFDDFEHAYIDNANFIDKANTTISGSPFTPQRLLSYFGRINYDYKNTYMATLVLRADGSSNFAPDKRWGYFPSVSAGWVVTNEKFMEKTSKWLEFLKIRASWGQNGNQSIDPFQYLSVISFDKYYSFGANDTPYSQGAYPSILPNKDVTWETSEQLDLGVDARFFRGRLGVVFDWYNKTTKDWLVQAPVAAIQGTGAPFINGGKIQNKGWEFGISWNDTHNEFSYGVSVNISRNKNKVLEIANSEGIIRGPLSILSHNTDWFYAAAEGLPIGYFYGYKTAGVFQNQEQIDNYVNSKGEKIMPNAVPGDLIFVNMNDDNVINEDDKTVLGDPNPDLNFNFGFNCQYKGLDFSLTANGVTGNQIARSYRSFSQKPFENYTSEILGRWHGEGTSNDIPRVTAANHINDKYISDRYIEDGDYLRISNITLGYDFKKLIENIPLQKARIYVSVQNLYTFTGYKGLDPEVGYGGDSKNGEVNWAGGIDVGFYPTPRTYMFGISLTY